MAQRGDFSRTVQKRRNKVFKGFAMESHAEEVDLSIHHRFTVESGLATAPVPLEPYRSETFFAAERDRVFGRAWLVAGRVEELPEPGDFVLKKIEIAGASILLTHKKGGGIGAFHNVCAHRGTEVVIAERGRASRFVCPYHNWTYGNEGQLIGVPDEKAFFGLDKKQCGLTPVAVDVWEGFIFINLQRTPEVSLGEFLGPLAGFLENVPYAFADNAVVVSSDVQANWKVLSDAFLETYHIPAIHPETIRSTFSSNSNPFGRLIDVRLLGEHAHVSMYGNPGYEINDKHKIDRVAMKSEGAGNVISAGKASDLAAFLDHPAVNPTGSAAWSMDSIHIFPNTHINWGPGGFWLHQFWPIDVNRTRHEVRFYMKEPADFGERLQQELYVTRVVEIIAEDLSNMERTQRGINSRAKDHMILQDNEVAIRRAVDNVMRWTAAGTVREAIGQ